MKPSLSLPESPPSGGWQWMISRWAESRWFFPVVLLATVVALFFDAVGPDCIFAFRDSLHFYPPLYRLVADEWLAGRVPLWNPLVNCGQPLAGMGTAGAFYPPQLLLTMLLPDGVSLNVYCILHLAFAATGAYFLARHQACSRPAATAAGIVYAFSGGVLLQIYNPVFAAGAAWLVWAVYGGMRLLEGRDIGDVVLDVLLVAVSLAMSVFAGDPQSAYHAGLVLGVCWLMQPGRPWRGLGLLTAAGVAGGILCLVQVALAAEFARESTRAVDLVPFSIWDVPRFLARPAEVRQGVAWYDVLIGRPPPGADHYHAIYRFPVEVYRLGELVWPGLSGPATARWPMLADLASGDWWTASIYCGMFPLLAAVAVVIGWPLTRQTRLWTALASLALLASCGQIGGGAIFRWGRELLTGEGGGFAYRAGDEVGGVYWMLASLLPGYAGFRYPAKWMTVVVLAVGQLAAQATDGLAVESFGGRIRRLVQGIALGTAAVEMAVVAMLALAAVRLGPAHVLPGPVAGAGRDAAFWRVLTGGVHGVAVAVLIAVLVGHSRQTGMGRWTGPALAMLVAADLFVAGRAELLVVPWSRVVEASSYLVGMQAGRRPEMAQCDQRVRIRKSTSSYRDHLRDGVWQIGLPAAGHLPWLHRCEIIGDPSTAMERDMDALRVSRHRGGKAIAPRRFLDSCGVEFLIVMNLREDEDNAPAVLNNWSARQLAGEFEGEVPQGDPLPALGIPVDGPAEIPPLARVCRNESSLPRARIVHEIATVDPVDRAQRDRWLGLLERVAFPTPDVPDLRRAAIVELPPGAGPPVPPNIPGTPAPATDGCRVVVDEPQRVVIEADLAAPGLLYLADTFHRDWTAAVATAGGPPRPATVLRANRVHRGVGLPAGRHRVEFRYSSRTFRRTAPITAAAWCVAAGILAWSLWQRGRGRAAGGAA